ncbi:MAG: hypothetical protein ABEJ76_03300 [Halanaeroarchaeum sp.]
MTAIESVGVHVPRYRIAADTVREAWGQFEPAGIQTVAVAGPDEDALTMAVEAAERALETSRHDRSAISTLAVGTTTPPLDESDLAAQATEMLGLPRAVESATFTQSTRAGTSALHSATALREGPALVVAADAPDGEPDEALGQAAGAGAVAFVLADDGPTVLEETGTATRAYPGTRFRERGSETVSAYGATTYERRAYTETIARAIEDLPGEPDAIAPSAPDGSMPYRATSDVDADPDVYQRASDLGDTGAASPLFGLLAAWDADEEDVVVVGYGDGASADALRLTGSAPVESGSIDPVEVTYAEYLRIRGDLVSAGGDR